MKRITDLWRAGTRPAAFEAISPIRDECLETKDAPTQEQADQDRVHPAKVKPAGGADIAHEAIVRPAAVGTDQLLGQLRAVAQVGERMLHAPGKPRQRSPEPFVNEQVNDRRRGETNPGIRPQSDDQSQAESGQVTERAHPGRPERRRQQARS